MRPHAELQAIVRCAQFMPLDGGWWSVKSPVDDKQLVVIASWGDSWDHVSVSRRNKMPSWREMEHVKRLFFRDDETAMQLHVPPRQHISFHPFCLHLWRPQNATIPLPPAWMVAGEKPEVV